MKAFAKMKKKARDRRERKKARNQLWEPWVNEQALVRAQQTSDATVGITAKFIHPYESPYIISKIIPPATYELATSTGKFRGNSINGL
jgi:hypothetical protein